MAKPDQSMAEIEGQIARTRAELGRTLDALSVELAPRHLVEQGVDMITGFVSGNRPGGIGLGGAIRGDPVPLALIGLGVGWLVAENIGLLDGITRSGPSTRTGTDIGDNGPAQRLEASAAAEPRGNGRGDGWLHRAAGAAQDALKSLYAGGGAALERAGDYIGEAVPSGARARHAGGRVVGSLEDNPLLLGLAGLAVGAALSMLLPPTRREQEFVAEAREDLWEKAEELGHRASDGVRSLAESSTHSPPGG
jgi:hypothetical protein